MHPQTYQGAKYKLIRRINKYIFQQINIVFILFIEKGTAIYSALITKYSFNHLVDFYFHDAFLLNKKG
jgi:hypothetical protein